MYSSLFFRSEALHLHHQNDQQKAEDALHQLIKHPEETNEGARPRTIRSY